jgi:hypothetical protein
MKRRVDDGQFKVDSLLFSITPPSAFAQKIYLSNTSKYWRDMPDSIKAKMGLVKLNEEGSWLGWSKEQDGIGVTKSGQYFLLEDTDAPKVVLIDREKGSLLVMDNLSGIKRCNALTKDNTWVMLRYDQKSNMLYWDTKKTAALKADVLKIQLEDFAGNKTEIPISIK